MNRIFNKINPWLLPIMIILFILEIFTFPFILNITYADRSENPDHFLTYTTNKLKWDYNTDIKPNGVVELSLFDIMYGQNAESYNGDKIVAPGLKNKDIIRFKNSSSEKIQYVAVLYKYNTVEDLPVIVDFKNNDLVNAQEYYLPNELEHVQVLRSVSGTLKPNKIQDFDIGWEWKFHLSDNQDKKDTFLGNKKILDETLVGFYLVVKENVSEPGSGGSGGGGGGIVVRPPKDEPDTPDQPDLPDNPDIPDVPDVPDIPDEPEVPDNPNIPDQPEIPEEPGEIETEPSEIIKPEVPKTGDQRLFEMYITLMIISGFVLLIMIIEKRLEKKEK